MVLQHSFIRLFEVTEAMQSENCRSTKAVLASKMMTFFADIVFQLYEDWVRVSTVFDFSGNGGEWGAGLSYSL